MLLILIMVGSRTFYVGCISDPNWTLQKKGPDGVEVGGRGLVEEVRGQGESKGARGADGRGVGRGTRSLHQWMWIKFRT
jgi:hypothetical protein